MLKQTNTIHWDNQCDEDEEYNEYITIQYIV